MSEDEYGSDLECLACPDEDVVSVSSSQVEEGATSEEELVETRVGDRFPRLCICLQKVQGVAQWHQRILRICNSVEEAEVLVWRTQHNIRCMGLKRTWRAGSTIRRSRPTMPHGRRRTAATSIGLFRKRFILSASWQRFGIGRQIPMRSGAQLFRRLRQVYPTAHYEDYWENCRWNKRLLYLDLRLMRAHHREVLGALPQVEIPSSPVSVSS